MIMKTQEALLEDAKNKPDPDFTMEIKGRVAFSITVDAKGNPTAVNDSTGVRLYTVHPAETHMAWRLAPSVRHGLPGSVIKEIAQYIPRSIIIEALDSDSSNLNKIYKRNLSKNETDVVEDLTSLWAELRVFFNGDDDMLKQWIATPLPILCGEQPDSLMDTIGGRNKIRQLLNKMRYGDF